MIRDELPDDAVAIRKLHSLAFGSNFEAQIVDALRDAHAAVISQVALESGRIIGHVLLSPVRIERNSDDVAVLGLAPLGVTPEHQRKGVGATLTRSAIDQACAQGVAAIVLVGEPSYYQRFGFVPATRFGLRCKWPGTTEAFMTLELVPGALAGCQGLVSYHEAFDIFE